MKKSNVLDMIPDCWKVSLNLEGVRYFPLLMIKGAPDESSEIYCGFCAKPRNPEDDGLGLYVSPTGDFNERLYMCPSCREKYERKREDD